MALKKWSELSPSSQRRLKSQGVGPAERAAAIRRQGKYGSLSATYKKDLARAGVDKKAYEKGVSLKAARRHTATPERPKWAKEAIALDIGEVIPLEVFWALPSGKREEMGRQWVLGFMSEGHHSEEQHDLRMDFLDAYAELEGEEFPYRGEDEGWKAFKAAYRRHFTTGTATATKKAA